MKRIIFCTVAAITIYSCTEHTKTTTVKFTDKAVKNIRIPPSNKDSFPKDTVNIYKATNDSIVAGKRIADVFLDQTSEEVIVQLGKPDSSAAGMHKVWMTWYGKPTMNNGDTIPHIIEVFAAMKVDDKEGKYRVKKIRVVSPLFKTAEKVGCGSTLAYIKLQYPILKKPVSSFADEQGNDIELYDDLKDGIAFEICNNKCRAIVVHGIGQKTIELPL